MTARLRILLCGTGQNGLGQTVRLTRIARQLREALHGDVELLVATGIPGARSLFASAAYEVMELSTPMAFTSWGGGHALTSATDAQRRVLADELHELIASSRPNVFVTPHYGGLAGELALVYPTLRKQGVRMILALRDFYDSDGFVDESLLETSLQDYVDQVIVFAPKHATGGLPDLIRRAPSAKVAYVGYVPPPTQRGTVEQPVERRAGIAVHCQVGGGVDGALLINATIDATLKARQRGVRVTLTATTGPFARPGDLAEGQHRLGSAGTIQRWTFRDEAPDQSPSDLRVSMAGYNSCVDAVWDRANTLVFPRLRLEDREQATRARFFEAYFGAIQTAEAKTEAELVQTIERAMSLTGLNPCRIASDCFSDPLIVAGLVAGDAFAPLVTDR